MAKRRASSSKKLLTLKHPAAQDTANAEPNQNGAAVATAAEEARQRIAKAAYYKAERRAFASGYEIDDWLAAEAEITGCSLQRSAPAAELH